MFSAKAATDVGRIAQARSAVERREAAHALLGSARAVGALEVARLAALAEQRDGGADGDLTELRDAVAAARAFIEAHLAR
jgi:HPt (histidine-containing phosphotransfer) domain-containing protein